MPRSIRRLLVTVLGGAALLLSATPAFAADEPVLRGTVLDADGAPFEVDQARMTMTGPDGAGIHAAPLVIAPDGTFEVALMPWGTTEAPAAVLIAVTGAVTEQVPNADGCVDDYAPVAEATFDVALESGGEPEPVAVIAESRIVGTVCGTTVSGAPTLPPSEVTPETPAPTVAPAAPVADGDDQTPWLPIVLVAVLAIGALLGAWRLLAGRSAA